MAQVKQHNTFALHSGGGYITYFCKARCAIAEGGVKLLGMPVGCIGHHDGSSGLFFAMFAGIGGVAFLPYPKLSRLHLDTAVDLYANINQPSAADVADSPVFGQRILHDFYTSPFGEHVVNAVGAALERLLLFAFLASPTLAISKASASLNRWANWSMIIWSCCLEEFPISITDSLDFDSKIQSPRLDFRAYFHTVILFQQFSVRFDDYV